MAKQGNTDTDMGLANIFKEIDSLKEMRVKVGIPDDGKEHDDVLVAQYAYWNEMGVRNKDGSEWYIPPRPFIRTTLDSKREKISLTEEKLYGLVLDGKVAAKTALQKLGDAVADMIRDTIKNGTWEKNSDVTINGSAVTGVIKETKISKKTGKAYTKTTKKQFIKGKKSSKPLIDSSTMLKSITGIVEKKSTGKNDTTHYVE